MPPDEMPSSYRSNWTIETLRAYFEAVIQANDQRYEQRFQAQQLASQTAFEAQTTAMATAFISQKEAVNNAMIAADKAVSAALAAADRAVVKAEVAAEKRFDSVNEFRSLVSDQQRTLMPRVETELLVHTLSERIASLEEQVNTIRSTGAGTRQGWGNAIVVAAIATSVLSFVTSVILHFIK